MILDQGNGQKVSRISLNVLSSVLLTVAVLTSCTAKEEPDSLVVFASASDVGLGKARVPLTIALIDGTRYDDQADSLVVTYTPPKSDESRLVEDLTWRPWPMRSGAYTATMNFDRVGFWTITVSSIEEDAMESANGAVLVKSDTDAPDIGDQAPRSVTKTVPSDGNLKTITSAPSPDPDLYSISFADAIETSKPTVIAFSTPAYCQTATCGPQTEVLSALDDKYSGQANFIHVEIFDNPAEMLESGDPSVGVESPVIHEWEFHTEPWTYIVDSDGIVVGRYETFVTEEELEETLAPLLAAS